MRQFYLFKALVGLLFLSPFVATAQNVGIGTATPTQRLHIAGSLRLDGPLMPDNNAGLDGNALLSRGPGLTPRWGSATEGQQFTTVYTTGSVNLNNGVNAQVPGLFTTVTVPSTGSYDVYIYTDGAAQLNPGLGVGNTGNQLAIIILVDGVMVRAITTIVDNTSNFIGGIRSFVSSFYTSLTPGNHTVEIRAQNMGGASFVTVGAPYAPGSFLVGSLTVGLIKR